VVVILTYILLYSAPAVISGCLLVVLAGAALMSEVDVGDELLPGLRIADLVPKAVARYKEVSGHFMLLLSIPGLTPEDVLTLQRHRPAPAVAHPPALPPSSACGAKVSSAAEGELCRSGGGDEFDAAVRFLRRPQLSLGLHQQMRLQSLYVQATAGDAAPTSGSNSSLSSSGAALARAQLEAWQCLRGVPQTTARGWLPLALAQVDPVFSAAHPRLARSSGGSWGTGALATGAQLLERRLALDFDDRVAHVQRCLLNASLTGTVLAVLATLRSAIASRSSSRSVSRWARTRWPSFGVVLGAIVSAYLYAVARGLPPWLHAVVLRTRQRALRGQAEGELPPTASQPSDAVARLHGRAWRAVLPRVSPPLLSHEA